MTLRKTLLIILLVAVSTMHHAAGFTHYSEWIVSSEMERVSHPYNLDFSPSKAHWDYAVGIELEGMLDVFLRYGDASVAAYLQEYPLKMISDDGTISGYKYSDFNLDNVRPAHFLMRYYQLFPTEKDSLALETLLSQLDNQQRTADGVWWHKAVYAQQVWLDGIFMGLPYYVMAAPWLREGREDSYYDDAVSQIMTTDQRTYDASTRLWKHAWDETHQMFWADATTGQSQHTWARALGWFAMALVEVLEALPQDYDRRNEVLDLFHRVMAGVVDYQEASSGVWYDVLDVTDPRNYLEATASSMFAYCLLKGYRMGWLDITYLRAGVRAYKGIVSEFVQPNGDGTMSLTRCCSVSGLGPANKPKRDGSFDYYMSEPIRDNDPKGIGPFIWASLEMERMGYTVQNLDTYIPAVLDDGSGDDQPVEAGDVMEVATKVAGYFMDHYPDVGANSYVGGKERNSRIWTRSVFYEGLLNMYRENHRQEWLQYALDWGEFHEWYTCSDSQLHNADFHCCGQSYLQLYQMEPSHAERMAHIKQRIDELMASGRINDWTWIDAIQMDMPNFALLGTITGNTDYWEYMYQMYQYTRNRQGGSKKGGGQPLFNSSTGLWYRDYKFDPPYRDLTEPDKDCYWSRGNGWVYMALSRVLQFTPANEAHRADYEADFRLMSQALLDCQRADGSWNVSLAAPTNYGAEGSEGPEMTGTSLFVGGMAYGVRSGLLDADTYLPAIRRGWQAMRRAVHPDSGFVGYLQGTGEKPEDGGPITYDSVPNFEDFGFGCWLWGAAEVHALVANGQQSLRGDVNGDGAVNVGDIMAIINVMAVQEGAAGERNADADVNGDGAVNVGDIMAVINIMADSASIIEN